MFNNYNEIKVYNLVDVAFGSYTEVYVCRGAAADAISVMAKGHRQNMEIHDARLLYLGQESLENIDLVYRCKDESSGKTTSWFLSREEAVEAAKRLGLPPVDNGSGRAQYVSQHAILYADTIDPAPQTFQVNFQKGKDGRLSARYNLHPELDGENSKGKMIFPDKSFTSADVGPATVSVTREFDGYAFVTGTMDRFDNLSLDEVLDWAWDHEEDTRTLVTLNHPARGRYYAIKIAGTVPSYHRVRKGDGFIYEERVSLDNIASYDAERYIERETTFDQLFAESAWGEGVKLDEVLGLFKESVFYEAGGRGCYWVKSQAYMGDIIKKGVAAGVLYQRREEKTSVEIISFTGNYLRLLDFSYDDVKQMAEAMSAINAKADEKTERFRRSGKLR